MEPKVFRSTALSAAWDGLTVLHISDLHLKGTPDRDYYRFVMDRCADWRPDIVAVTGDIADSYHDATAAAVERASWSRCGRAA